MTEHESLWLGRLADNPIGKSAERVYRGSKDLYDHLVSLGMLRGDVVDIGCGIGRAAIFLPEDYRYHGYDVREVDIRFANEAFPESRFRFTHVPIRNEAYFPEGTLSPEEFRLEEDDGSVDSVICHSLFTHLGTLAVASRYLAEIRRVLHPGGRTYLTWFRSPPNEVSTDAGRTVFREADIIWLLRDFVITKSSIYLPWNEIGGHGMTTHVHDQWRMVVTT